MSYIDLFIDSKKPLISPRFKCVEDDWRELEMIFPEQGFRSYFIGYLVSKLRKELKENGINSYQDRLDSPRLSNITRFMSDIHFVGHEGLADDGRRVEPARGEAAQRAGDSGNHEDVANSGSQEGQGESRTEEAGPRPVGLVEIPVDVRDRLAVIYLEQYHHQRTLPFNVPKGANLHDWLAEQPDDHVVHYYRRWMRCPSTLLESNKV